MARPKRKRNSPPKTTDRRAVVVLGMHRSGTSALCGALDLIGVDFGKHLLSATDANEKGHWEHEEIVRVHDGLLAALGSGWNDDEPLPSDWVEREITREVGSRLIGILERDFAHSSVFGMKDPRLCRLLPFWFPIFQTLRIEPYFVLVVRHPWEVAESLAKRDGIEHSRSYLLWLEHVVQAESATRGHKRSFVRYEELVDDPIALLGELREQIGADLRELSGIQTLLRQFLDPALRHHRFTEKAGKLKRPVPQLALDFYDTIRKASTSQEITSKLEPLAVQFILERKLLYPRSIRTEKLAPEDVSKISLEVSVPPREVHVSVPFWLDATVTNESNRTLCSAAPYPVRLAYHWIEKTTRQMAVFEGYRSGLSRGVDPHAATRYPMKIVAPNQPGEYILQTTIVQEGVCWFENIQSGIVQEFAVSVIAGSEGVLPAAPIVSPKSEATGRATAKPHRLRVDIIVCVHSKLDMVKKCLQALRQFTSMPYSFILIHDGSDDETRKYLVDFALAEGAMLLRNDVRTGFSGTVDKALRHSSADYVLLLSSDVEVEPAWLDRMVTCAESDDLIGLVAPLSNYDTQPPQGCAGSTPPEPAKSTRSAARTAEILTQIYPRVIFLNGFCVMIKRAVINQVGYLGGAGFGQWLAETTDYCVRAGNAGWQLALATDVNVFYKPS